MALSANQIKAQSISLKTRLIRTGNQPTNFMENSENRSCSIWSRICRIKLWNRPLSKIGANINGRDCFCDSSCQDFRDCCSDHAETCPELTTKKTSQQTTTAITTLSTTKKPKNTRPPTIKDESWIFDKLFESLQNIIDEKFGKSTKYQNFIDRLENTRFYFLNAEHNCRFNKDRSLEKRFVINEKLARSL